MLETIDHICATTAPVCEDAIGWGKGFLFAIDGASGLTGSHIMEAGSDAAWFAAGVRDGLMRAFAEESDRPTQDILREVIGELRQEYETRIKTLGWTEPPDMPSACLAIFREMGEDVEFFGLGDCIGVAQLQDGTLWSSCDVMLPALDNTVIEQMKKIHTEQGVSIFEAREQCNDLLLENRMKMNRPGGYWILETSGAGLPHARVQRWKKQELRAVSTFSDGFAQLTEVFHIYVDYAAIHQGMVQTPLQDMVAQLFAAQEQDPQGNQFPRLKFRDDTCALWAKVHP